MFWTQSLGLSRAITHAFTLLLHPATGRSQIPLRSGSGWVCPLDPESESGTGANPDFARLEPGLIGNTSGDVVLLGFCLAGLSRGVFQVFCPSFGYVFGYVKHA
jgi:hypothetical protein